MSFRSLYLIAFTGAFLGSIAFADDATERAKLNGTWQSQGGSAAIAVWTLDGQGDVFHITNSLGDKKIAEFACNLGKECEVKDAGRKIKVTLFFNGPKLVLLKTRGEEVVKLRFGSVETGDALDLEVIPVSPDGKTETLHLKRLPNVAASAK
jgi:hypothetical protein